MSCCGGDFWILCVCSSIPPIGVYSGFITVVNGRISPTVGAFTHSSLFFLLQQVCFRPLFLCLPKESRQDNCPLLREKSRKSNKTSTVVWYFHSPIQGVSLFRHSLTFLWIVFRQHQASPAINIRWPRRQHQAAPPAVNIRLPRRQHQPFPPSTAE